MSLEFASFLLLYMQVESEKKFTFCLQGNDAFFAFFLFLLFWCPRSVATEAPLTVSKKELFCVAKGKQKQELQCCSEKQRSAKLRHGSEHGVVTADARTVLLVGGFRVTHLVELGR